MYLPLNRRKGRPPQRFVQQLAWNLARLGFSQRQIQAHLKLLAAALEVTTDEKTGKPTSLPAVDATLAALKQGKLGDTGGKDGLPYFRTAARAIKKGERYVAGLPIAFRKLLKRDLTEQRRFRRAGKSVVNSVVKSSGKTGVQRGSRGKKERPRSA